MTSRIESLRHARTWSRLELATLADVTEATIIRAERHDPPPVNTRTLAKIAAALGVPVVDLLAPATDATGVVLPPNTSGDPDVLFIQDLAVILRTTVRRVAGLMKRTPWLLPEPLPPIDKRWRWSRVVVDRWLELRDQDRRARARAMAAR